MLLKLSGVLGWPAFFAARGIGLIYWTKVDQAISTSIRLAPVGKPEIQNIYVCL